MSGLTQKFKKSKIILQEEGLATLIGHSFHVLVAKTGWFKDHWFLGKLVEMRGNVGYLDGCRFKLNSPIINTKNKSSFIQGTYEKDERKAIRKFLNPSLPVIELGASIGVVSCVTNKKLINPQGHVVVEANTNLIPILKENRDFNSCSFVVLNKALGYGSKEATFYVNDKFLSGSIQRVTQKSITIPTVTLKNLFSEYNFKFANLICDIEGGELDLINNEKDLLGEKVFQIILEVHPSVLGEDRVNILKKDLESVGFRKIRTGTHGTVWVFENENIKEFLSRSSLPR